MNHIKYIYNIGKVYPSEFIISLILAFQLIIVVIITMRIAYKRLREPLLMSKRLSQARILRLLGGVFRRVSSPCLFWSLTFFTATINVYVSIIGKAPPFATALGLGNANTIPPFFAFLLTTGMSIFLSVFTHIALWQFESELLRRYSCIERQWAKPGEQHKVFLLEALVTLEKVAQKVAGEIEYNNQYDTFHSGIALQLEDDIKRLLEVQQDLNIAFLCLDKSNGCSERIIEDLFLLITEKTIKPLIRRTARLMSSTEEPVLFPTAYATLIWAISLSLTAKLSPPAFATVSATSVVPFGRFYNYYHDHKYFYSFVKGNARRLFLLPQSIVPAIWDWKDEFRNQLLAIDDGDTEETKLLPKSTSDQKPRSYLEWIIECHTMMNWDVRFYSLEEAEEKLRRNHAVCVKHVDFMVVPTENDWDVIISADLKSTKRDDDAFALPLELCPIQVLYEKSRASISFYDTLWNSAMGPVAWLEQEITDTVIQKSPAYRDLIRRLSTHEVITTEKR